jgi:Na+-transporting methylmalonyl-CoA/oxaloacetate decarboxylase gamma subunit
MKDKSTKSKNVTRKTVNANNVKAKAKSKKKKYSRQLSVRGITTIVVMVLLLLLVLIVSISSIANRNDVEKISNKLDSNMGKSISDLEKSTRVDFYQSASNELLANLTKFNYVAESTTTTRVCGVKTPKWVIYTKINKLETITQFTMYNFSILEDNVLGVEVAQRIDTSSYVGASQDSLTASMGMQPYITNIAEDGSKVLYYRYYYRDSSSKNDTAVQVCVELDSSGTVTNVSESDIDFISKVLSLEDVSQHRPMVN